MRVCLLGVLASLLTAGAAAQRTISVELPNHMATIQADLYGTGARAVVLAHGGRFDKASWRPQAEALAAAGFMVLAVQFRGDRLNPDGTPSAEGSPEDNATDVLAAVAYCHQVGAKTVSAVGGSLGGDAVGDADVGSKPGEIDRIVLLGSSGGDNPQRLQGRKLFVVAREDRSSFGPRLPAISESYAKAHEPKKLLVLEGSAHAQSLFSTAAGPSLMKMILGFLTEP